MATQAELLQKALREMQRAAWDPKRWCASIQKGYPVGTPYRWQETANFRAQQALWDAVHAATNPGPVPGPTPGPIPTPNPFPTVKSPTAGRNGIYYYNATPDILASHLPLLKQHNMWCAILVNETDLTPYRNGARLSNSYLFAMRDQIKSHGVTAVATGWAEPFGNLDSQAAKIGEMSQGFDEYMLNIEAAWVYEAGPDAFARSDIFAPKVRAAIGNQPLSVCPDWGNNVHWHPWLMAGMSAVRWQCYLNEWEHKTPLRCIYGKPDNFMQRGQHDLPAGIPQAIASEICYGKYTPGTPKNRPLSTWTAYDDQAGKPARSCWAGEFCDTADIQWLAR